MADSPQSTEVSRRIVPDSLLTRTDMSNRLDEKSEVFKEGLDALEQKLSQRYYTSVTAFSADISIIFSSALAQIDGPQSNESTGDMLQIHSQLNEVPAGAAERLALTQEQKELKRLAKRIVKAVKEPLEDALRKEASLKGIPFAKEQSEWAAFDARLEHSVESRRGSILAQPTGGTEIITDISENAVGGASPSPRKNSTVEDEEPGNPKRKVANGELGRLRQSEDIVANDGILARDAHTAGAKKVSRSSAKSGPHDSAQPLSPPISTSSIAQMAENTRITCGERGVLQDSSAADPWALGGLPWYWASFDITGTTVYDERWTGPETIRDMSEVLSEMDDEDLRVLEQSTATVIDDKDEDASHALPLRRSLRGGANADTEMDEETEAQKTARAKKDAYNLKRRLQRAANRKK